MKLAMWSDNDIDNAFQRLNPPEPEPTPFPLDAWLRLENQLDKAVIEHAVRRRLWQFFAAEVGIVALIVLGWLAWPTLARKASLAGADPESLTAALTSARLTTTKASPAASGHQAEGITKAATSAAEAGAAQASAAPVAEAAPATTETAAAATESAAATGAAAAANPVASGQASAGSQLAVATFVPTRKPAAAVPQHDSRLATASVAGRKPERLSGLLPSSKEEAGRFAGRARQAARLAEDHQPAGARATRAPAGSAATPRKPSNGGTGGIGYSNENQSPIRHPAAGSLTALAEAPTGAVVAAAASRSRPLRERQLPLAASSAQADAGLATSSAVKTKTAAAAATKITQHKEANATPTATDTAGTTAPAAALPTALTDLTPTDASLLLPATAGLPAPLATVAVPPSNLPVPVRQPRFYVGLVAAPDVSTVRFASVEKPMPNLGVVLEYRITNRLRVNTGLLRSTKSYLARRDDYDWGAYSKQVYSREFNDVDGTCTVLDIPLNLRYDLLARPQYRLFGSAGLSSFFMQREHYYYDWTDANGFHAWNGYAVNQNRHLFSVLNLSAGYEHSLGRHLSVQAEPYVKVPLGGVGLGKVRLTSAGVFFGVKYGF